MIVSQFIKNRMGRLSPFPTTRYPTLVSRNAVVIFAALAEPSLPKFSLNALRTMGVVMPRRKAKQEHFTKIIRTTMEEPAWRALSSTAQALYPWLKLQWRGADNNNNGQIRFSVRQAAKGLGIGRDTAARAFRDLQAKGFIIATEPARLGLTGDAKSTAYEITELKSRSSDSPDGRKLYRDWREGHDFPVCKVDANNPQGNNQKTKPCHHNQDRDVIKIGTYLKKTSSK